MDIVDIKDTFKNSKILLIVLGTLLIPVINSFDSLLTGLYKIFGLSIKNLLIASISFHGLISICLIAVLYWIISSPGQSDGQVKIIFSLRALKIWGLTSFIIIISSAAINIYFKLHGDKAPDVSQINTDSFTIFDLAYLTMTQTGLLTLRNILLFTIYFVIVFRRK